jgi:methylase of polypeptide subunit release factors
MIVVQIKSRKVTAMQQQRVPLSSTTFTIGKVSLQLQQFAQVMEPSPYTLALAEQLSDKGATRALDIGCGSGMIAILLALQGVAEVWAVDIDAQAIAATAANALLNRVAQRVTPLASDVYKALPPGLRFDLIVANPPATPAWRNIPAYNRAGVDGRLVLDQIIVAAPHYLTSGGQLIFAHSSRLHWDTTTALLAQCALRYEIIGYREVPSRPEYYQHYPEYFAELEAQHAVFLRDNGFYEAVRIVRAW